MVCLLHNEIAWNCKVKMYENEDPKQALLSTRKNFFFAIIGKNKKRKRLSMEQAHEIRRL